MAVPISNVTRRQVYAPSGSGGAGPYAFTFEILANTDIAVYKDDVLLTLTTHYTVTINSNGTGSVTITAAGLALSPTSPAQYAIVGNRTISRSTDFTTGGDFFANVLNDELDQQTIFAQQNAEGLGRALQAPQTDPTSINMTLPRASQRANKYLAFDASGNPVPGDTATEVAGVYAIRDEIAAVAAIDDQVVAVDGNSTNINTVATNISNVNAVGSNISNVNSVAGNATNINAVNSNATNINTVAGISSNVTTVAGVSANVTTVATNIAAVNTNATNIVAIQNAASNASAAASSASAAATSEANAASSAASAASALDSFDDRYLGSKTSNPTVDNDGNALVTGALYYRSTSPIGMKVYDGAQWIEASAAQQAALVTYEYVATAGQTTFSGADANSLTLSYIAGGLIVSLNGAILRPGDDYTATNGTSIVLAVAASLNDELCAYAFSSFQVANTYTQAQTDALLATKQATDAELTTLAGMSSSRATFLASANDFGFRNRIINGDMRIDQRNAGASVTPTANDYTLDRWAFDLSQASKLTTQQNAGSVTPPTGFSKYLGIVSSSAYVVGATDYFVVKQVVEGFNISDFGWGAAGAQPVTLSFWVRSSLTGTFGGVVGNGNNTRAYPFTYTISSANTWEQKTITVSGDVTGTWATDNTAGLELNFGLGVGSTYSASAGAWAAGNFLSATGATSVVGTSGATFYITGVQLEAGTVATPFERRDYGRELMMCQRYYNKTFDTAIGSTPGDDGAIYTSTNTNTSSSFDMRVNIRFPVIMRAAPTITFQNPTQVWGNTNWRISADTSDVVVFVGNTNTQGTSARCSAVPGQQWARGQYQASAEL